MASGGVIITHDSLGATLANAEEKVLAATRAALEMNSSRVQSYARSNAPWTDQTSNARNGLFAEAFSEGQKAGIVLYHTMEYGLWLEVRWSGRYATILPTIRAMGPQVMASLRTVLKRIAV